MSFCRRLGSKYNSTSKKGIIELQMTDVAGAGYAVGCALAGARPIFVIRFQSFLWLNSSPIVMHAAKTKEIFGYNCPVFVRAIASEGIGSGPLHTNCYHSPFASMPGLQICAPMTPYEYKNIWKAFKRIINLCWLVNIEGHINLILSLKIKLKKILKSQYLLFLLEDLILKKQKTF